MQTFEITITGIVQGVGMRPALFRLATDLGLAGWVNNASDGVHLQVRGTTEALREFLDRLPLELSPRAQVEGVQVREVADDPSLGTSFSITESQEVEGQVTLVSPDIATCPQCVHELFDPDNRRYHYPFINCTQCGPRFTIIDGLPYDRPATVMRQFTMCPDCDQEYHNPADRRFHAQPDACFECGPELFWLQEGQREVAHDLESSDALIQRAVRLMEEGGILAIKGLGGYHLACDAGNEEAVAALRQRKRRPHKPFACMVPDLASARHICKVNAQEEALLCGTAGPILLLQLRDDAPSAIAGNVAGGLAELGIMLPHTPVQHLLLSKIGRPLVMTSGNITEEPIIADDVQAENHLLGIADALLGNTRSIHVRFDDSVVRVVGDSVQMVRRARGYAPSPVELPPALSAGPALLSCGPEQKNTLCLTQGNRAYVSQHLGDVENNETWQAWEQAREHYTRLFRVEPTVLACDQHPSYLTSQWARRQAAEKGCKLVEVQHHHAHIAAVTGEHNRPDPVIGIALDGTGYGDDDTVWGAEILVCDWKDCRRAASLQLMPLPGGAAAIHNPYRIAFGTLHASGLEEHPGAAPFLESVPVEERQLLCQMVDRNVNTPLTSSAGRLFDLVSALVGCCPVTTYDGQAAMELEALAHKAAMLPDSPPEGITGASGSENCHVLRIPVKPLIEEVLDLAHRGEDPAGISATFHEHFCRAIVAHAANVARSEGIGTVALSGGVFANRLVLTRMVDMLSEEGLEVLLPKQLPANDGCIAYGQAIVALARLQDQEGEA